MMKPLFCSAVFIALFLSAGLCFGQSGELDHKIEVEKIAFEWKVEKELIHVRLTAETTGWVGIGFNPSVEMKDANFVIGYVKKGKVKVTDHFGVTNRQHQKDEKVGGKNNITNIAGSEKNDITEISFTIPLNSGDSKDQALVPDKDSTILLAYGLGRDSFRTKHKFKAVLNVNLKTGQFKRVK
jgi:DOMON domain